jgi:hypothetical protein
MEKWTEEQREGFWEAVWGRFNNWFYEYNTDHSCSGCGQGQEPPWPDQMAEIEAIVTDELKWTDKE